MLYLYLATILQMCIGYEVIDSQWGEKCWVTNITSYPTRCEWNNSFIKYTNHSTIYTSQSNFCNYYSSKSSHLSESTLQWFGGLFDTLTYIENFHTFQTSLKFAFPLSTTPAICNISFLILEIESKTMLDLLNVRLMILLWNNWKWFAWQCWTQVKNCSIN